MPVEHINGTTGGSGAMSLPATDPQDVIMLVTMRNGTEYPAPTTGYDTVALLANTGLNDVLRGRLEWRTNLIGPITIPANTGGGVLRRIAEVYRGLEFNPLPVHGLAYARSDTPPATEDELQFNVLPTDESNEWVFSVAFFAGDATDETTPPAGLTLRHTTGTTTRIATYDSNAAPLATSYIGPPFAINRRWATLSWHMYPYPAAYLNQVLEDITLESQAFLTRFAVLDQTLEDITLESEAYIPPVTDADLDQTVAFVTLQSSATITQPEPIVCTAEPAPIFNGCTSVVNHAVYASLNLYDVLLNALYPAIRESNPATAYDTMEDWLDRLNWQDCMGACRMPGINGVLPTEIVGECGSYVVDLTYDDCLVKTLQHGTIMALTRMQFGRTKNLCFVNDVIAPLGAVVYPTPGLEAECPHKMTIAPMTDALDTWQKGGCVPQADATCLAYYTPNPDDPPGLPSRIYPGLMAAECIVRSMFAQYRFIEFERLIAVPSSIPDCSSLDI